MSETAIRWQDIAMFITDCDGVLTDGGVYMDSAGIESRRFHIHDGLGLRALLKAGLPVAIISAANASSIAHRGQQLGIEETHIAVSDKTTLVQELAQKYQIALEAIAFMGDDLVDVGPMNCVGFPISVANGRPEAKSCARYITATPGGSGAVREVTDLILQARDNT